MISNTISSMITKFAIKNANEMKEKIVFFHQPEVPAALKK